MTFKEPGLAALRLAVVAVRTPWEMLNEQVVARAFGAGSTPYRTLTQGLHTFDSLAEKGLAACTGEPDEPREHDEKVEPDPPTTSPASRPAAGGTRGENPIAADEQQEIDERAAGYLAEQESQTFTGELADDEVRRAQAEIRAKQQVEDEHGQF